MMLKHAVILTEDLLANDTIIDEGLRAFVAIVKDLGWHLAVRLRGRLDKEEAVGPSQARKVYSGQGYAA
jgi:hypothetical protein